MPDDTRALEIQILTKYLGEAEAKKAAADLDKLRESQEGSGKAAEAANPHFEHSRLLFTEMNKIVPGLGHELHAAFAGPIGPIILLALGIAEAKKALDEYNKSLDDQGELAAQPVIDSVKQVETAWGDAKKKFGEYLAAVADAGKDKDPIDEQLKQQKAIEDANLAALGKLISPEQRESLKSGASIGRLQQEFNERSTPGLSAHLALTAEDAARNAAEAASRFEQNQKTIERTSALLNPETEEGKKFQAQQEKAAARLNLAKSDPLQEDPATKMMVENAQDEVDRLGEQRANLMREHATALANVQPLATQKKLADDAAARADAEGKRNASRLAELPGQIDTETAAQKQQETIEGLSKLFDKYAEGHAVLHSIVKFHIENTTTIAQEQEAMKNALRTLQSRVQRTDNYSFLH